MDSSVAKIHSSPSDAKLQTERASTFQENDSSLHKPAAHHDHAKSPGVEVSNTKLGSVAVPIEGGELQGGAEVSNSESGTSPTSAVAINNTDAQRAVEDAISESGTMSATVEKPQLQGGVEVSSTIPVPVGPVKETEDQKSAEDVKSESSTAPTTIDTISPRKGAEVSNSESSPIPFPIENTQAQGGHSYLQELAEFDRKTKSKTRPDHASIFTNDSNFSKRSKLKNKFTKVVKKVMGRDGKEKN
ncbi:hypothetical protein CPB83DRAFT_621097 [Crepidotus variabilis]|uniref:Uncharacterized protein n=1 Tax=Crepidotus variabilis TaxID=179855 RepID=A0A9P6JKR8_9AGAR|nr:hypothetical protein CPB83DRAFT_621097 [Crepidotus variabilis]